MLTARHALLFAVSTILAPLGATAQAQDLGLGYSYLFGYGASNTPAIRSFVPAPPYFSLHPPVYYGQRYSRPYGDSPFASWPQLQAAKGYHPRPAASYGQSNDCRYEIVNPHMPSLKAPSPSASPVVKSIEPVAPLIVDNPYYRSENESRLVASTPMED